MLSARTDVRKQGQAAGADDFVSMVEPPEVMLTTINRIAAFLLTGVEFQTT